MKVLKFGGTSVGSVESILSVKNIVESQTEPVIVVVSALGGITDQLLRTAQQALAGDVAYLASYAEMTRRHHDLIEAVIPVGSDRDALIRIVDGLLGLIHDATH